MGHATPPTPPTPPMPPTPPSHWDEDSISDYEQAMQHYEEEIERQARDYEQAMLGHEQQIEQRLSDKQQDRDQRLRDREQRRGDQEQRRVERQRDREQRRLERQRDREQRRLERDRRRGKGTNLEELHGRGQLKDSPIFTAGPSGRPYRDPQTAPAQPTEPVAPPQPFDEEEASMDQPAPQNDSQHTEPIASVDQGAEQPGMHEPKADDRITILELLERGEIDIDEAMARLEAEKER